VGQTLAELDSIAGQILTWQNDTQWSDQVKQENIEALEERAAVITDTAGPAWVNTAQTDFEALTTRRREQITAARIADPLNNPVAADDARQRLENIAKTSQSLQQFEAAYNKSMVDGNPYLTRAFQTHGPKHTRKWSPAGAFSARMERDYEASFIPTEENEAFTADLISLREGVRAAQTAVHRFWRDHRGRRGRGIFDVDAESPERALFAIGNAITAILGDDGFPKTELGVFAFGG
jgi:hypothetical protein